jgi:hypothetical protein
MPMRRFRTAVLIAITAALAGACRGSTSPSPPLDLSGAWAGMLGQPQSGSALRLTWTASQTGATVSGPATLVKPALNVPATGTMSGTLVGSQLTLTYSVPAGAVPVYLSCMIAASGSGTASIQTITGSLQTTFTNCLGSGLETPESAQFTLTRQ